MGTVLVYIYIYITYNFVAVPALSSWFPSNWLEDRAAHVTTSKLSRIKNTSILLVCKYPPAWKNEQSIYSTYTVHIKYIHTYIYIYIIIIIVIIIITFFILINIVIIIIVIVIIVIICILYIIYILGIHLNNPKHTTKHLTTQLEPRICHVFYVAEFIIFQIPPTSFTSRWLVPV